jgi:hypothetical protein
VRETERVSVCERDRERQRERDRERERERERKRGKLDQAFISLKNSTFH